MPEPVSTSGTDNAGTTAVATPSVTPAAAAPVTATPAVAVVAKPSAIASLQKVSAAASSAASPTVVPDPKSAGAGTTVQPGQPGANVGATGEDASWLAIPEARREVILKNAREKEATRVTAELESKYGWSKDVNPDHVQQAFGLANRVYDDPVTFVTQLISEIREIPQLAAKLAQALGQPGTGAPIAAGKREFPKPRLMAEDGKTGAYAADQVMEILDIFKGQMMEEFGGRMAPIEGFKESLEERQEVMNVIHESRQEATTLMTEMRALELWPSGDNKKAGEAKIAEYLAAIPAEVKRKIGSVASLYQAYNSYVQKDVLPTLRGSTEQEVRDNLRRKAAAGTGAVPVTAPTPAVGATKPRNVSELSKHMATLAGAGT